MKAWLLQKRASKNIFVCRTGLEEPLSRKPLLGKMVFGKQRFGNTVIRTKQFLENRFFKKRVLNYRFFEQAGFEKSVKKTAWVKPIFEKTDLGKNCFLLQTAQVGTS